MSTNAALFDRLLHQQVILLEPGSLLQAAPAPPARPISPDRVEGMMLGLAIGDALGNTSEGQLPAERAARYGEIRDYLANRHAGGRALGLPSDDTQLAFWTLEQILDDGALAPEALAERFAGREIYGIGQAVSEFVRNYRSGVRPWYRCAARSAGNGALMRIAPTLVPHLARPSTDLWADVALAAALTHNDPASTAACLAWTNMLWQLLQADAPPEPAWWAEAYVSAARDLEGDTHYRARGGAFADYEGPIWRFTELRHQETLRYGLSVRQACNAWHSGAYLLETMPSALYILARHADDPQEALLRAVNDTYDNDTIASLVGSAVGALHGRDHLPARWREGLLGRTGAGDDGRVQALVGRAKTLYVPEERPRAPRGSRIHRGPSNGRHGSEPAPEASSEGPAPTREPAQGPPVRPSLLASYWVEPGRLAAGEYPGAPPEAPELARRKLEALLDLGFTFFLDLTHPRDPLQPYGPLLAQQAAARGLRVEHCPLPVPDMGTPSAEGMVAILDALDRALVRGEQAYVHCWGGRGRTGTAVGCHLVRWGMAPHEALQRVREWYATTGRPFRSPETAEQEAFVLDWAAHDPIVALRPRAHGALLGLAAGDAVGTTVEFQHGPHQQTDMVGGGPFGLQPGQWTDDTSMALCLAASLVETGRFDPHDQMERYVRWWREGYMSSTGACFDIGGTTSVALAAFERTGDPLAGRTDPHSAGNGSIMRLAPVPLFYWRDRAAAVARSAESSRTTHGARTAVDACRYLGALIWGALQGVSKDELLSPAYWPLAGVQGPTLAPEVAEIAGGSFARKAPPEIVGSGYVVRSLEAALWAFHRSESYREGCLAAANLGDDADTTAAVYGQLAGAYYGEEAIPQAWREQTAMRETIVSLAERLMVGPWA